MSTTHNPDIVTLMAVWGSLSNFDPNMAPGFEGPEKRLEVIVRFTEFTDPQGLRSLEQSVWENVISTLNAQIVSKISNEYIDSYVLTESSLFVTKNRVLLITCGTTTLLNSLSLLLDAVSQARAEVEWASFMRKNFSFPWEQKEPHSSLQQECEILKKHFPAGKPFVVGPIDSDHYFFFSFDDVHRPCEEKDCQLSMTMYGLSTDLTKHLFSESFYSTGPETQRIRDESGLTRILDGWTIQDLQFAPCGYSVNAIRNDEYQTMHITPEDHCSFSSYETNTKADDLHERISTVLNVFRPQRFTAIVVVDPHSPIGVAYAAGRPIGLEAPLYNDYSLVNRTANEYEPGHFVIKLNFVMPHLKQKFISVKAQE